MFCTKCGARVAPVVDQQAGDMSPKSQLATSFLAFMIGNLGAHRFYVGKIRTAILMLAISVLGFGCGMGLGLFAATTATKADMESGMFTAGMMLSLLCCWGMAIWALIDFIIAVTGNFKDSHGKIIQKW